MATAMESAARAKGVLRVAGALAAATLLAACQFGTPSETPTTGPAFTVGPPPATDAPVRGLEPAGQAEDAVVLNVIDGDTIDVEIDGVRHTVRYIGIDAPEKPGPFTDPEPLGAEATQANELLVGGATVLLERDRSDTDRFDRLLRYVWLQTSLDGNGWLLVNRELVRQGLAESRSYEPDTYWQDVLDQAETDARSDGLGIWAAP
jgi:micrococcal nuclease